MKLNASPRLSAGIANNKRPIIGNRRPKHVVKMLRLASRKTCLFYHMQPYQTWCTSRVIYCCANKESPHRKISDLKTSIKLPFVPSPNIFLFCFDQKPILLNNFLSLQKTCTIACSLQLRSHHDLAISPPPSGAWPRQVEKLPILDALNKQVVFKSVHFSREYNIVLHDLWNAL